ncbi:MAG: type VI secretion system-associated FHA domain protein TagH, partial [Proteobacteria bacterium]|nr:type VI secretion system-associated FHA domain protein TagH [Pseudomonadota bacterium]
PQAASAFEDDLLKPNPAADPWAAEPVQADNADAPSHAFIAPRVTAPVSFDDFDDLLGDTPPGHAAPAPMAAPPPAPPMPPPPPMPSPEAASPMPIAPPPAPPPIPVPPSPPPPRQDMPAPPPAPPPAHAAVPAAAPTAPVPAGADAARLLAAFLDGAGMPALKTGDDPEAAMRAAGEVFRTMVEGVRQVLISRAAIKNELRVEQTMLRARDNNALKFSVTTDDAVAALLVPGRPGYQAPVAATREAFADISSHEMAVMAGVQTALMALLKRFEPGALEQRLTSTGLLGSVLPAARKARVWELFCATYGEIVREAEDDFQSVFGREFARAYDAQMRKL